MRYLARVLSAGMFNAGSMEYLALSRWVFSRIFLLIGWLFVIVGVIELPTPLPFGVPLIALGVTVILNTSPTAKKAFVLWGRRHPETVGRVRDIIRTRRRSWRRRREEGAPR
jgi:hypothetical protein